MSADTAPTVLAPHAPAGDARVSQLSGQELAARMRLERVESDRRRLTQSLQAAARVPFPRLG